MVPFYINTLASLMAASLAPLTPFYDAYIDISLPPAEFEAALSDVCLRLVPGWPALPRPLLAFHRVSGGITNALVRVERLDAPSPAPAVLVRVFGPGSELLSDRAVDGARSAWLGAQVGPAVHGAFRNGRVEAWIPDARPLLPEECDARDAPADVPRLVAGQLARFHGLREPRWEGAAAAGAGGAGPVLWRKLEAWAALAFAGDAAGCERWGAAVGALAEALPSPRNGGGEALLRGIVGEGGSSGGFCTSATAALCAGLAVPAARTPLLQARVDGAALAFRGVFCHNDLLSGNLLLVGGGGGGAAPPTLAFIDFEYGAPNFAGYDVANHWCEHVGFLPYALARLPGAGAQLHFLRAYVGALGLRAPTAASYGAGGGDEGGGEDEVSAAFWGELRRRCELFMLASHLWWGLWAGVQARHNAHTEFDYAEYSTARLGAFEEHGRLLLGAREGSP